MNGVHDSFSTYAASEDTPRYTDWLRERARPQWTRAVTHPFTSELGDGTLSESAFGEYLRQDYAFLDELVRTFAYAIGDAPDMSSRRPLVEFLDTLTNEENDFFTRSFDALDIDPSDWQDPELAEPIAAFVDLLGRARAEGGYAETLAVLVPAEWIYEQWATAVSSQPPVQSRSTATTSTADDSSVRAERVATQDDDLPFYYAEWIDLHATPTFVEFVDWLRGQLDDIGPGLAPRRQERVARLFCRTVTLEVMFFDHAYDSSDHSDGQVGNATDDRSPTSHQRRQNSTRQGDNR